MPNTPYDDEFFAYTTASSVRAARAIIPVVQELLPNVTSVVDFGCAQGAWLSTWSERDVSDIQGVDGDYVETSALLIPKTAFKPCDLNKSIDLGRRFDLAHSFEVAEHLRPENAAQFVESLTRHADVVLFSAAPPGQGGENHINEQPYDYWRNLFAVHGYSVYDAVRPALSGMVDEVSFWYRYNILLFVKNGSESLVSKEVLTTRVPDGQLISDISPFLFKVRKALVQVLPAGVQNALARMKAKSHG